MDAIQRVQARLASIPFLSRSLRASLWLYVTLACRWLLTDIDLSDSEDGVGHQKWLTVKSDTAVVSSFQPGCLPFFPGGVHFHFPRLHAQDDFGIRNRHLVIPV